MDLPAYYDDIFLDAGDAAGFDCPPYSVGLARRAERALGYKLPASYLRLLEIRNGGYLTRPLFPTERATSWAPDHVYVDRIFGIGGEDGIDSATGSRFLIEQWSYPLTGVVISSNGPTAFMLDYGECGPEGEPRVVYVDVEAGGGTDVLLVAPDFETFLSRLVAY